MFCKSFTDSKPNFSHVSSLDTGGNLPLRLLLSVLFVARNAMASLYRCWISSVKPSDMVCYVKQCKNLVPSSFGTGFAAEAPTVLQEDTRRHAQCNGREVCREAPGSEIGSGRAVPLQKCSELRGCCAPGIVTRAGGRFWALKSRLYTEEGDHPDSRARDTLLRLQ